MTTVASSEGSDSSPSSTSQTPSGKLPRTFSAARNANLVFPTPPIPVSVTRRAVRSNLRVSASSLRRPTKVVSSIGR